MDSMATPQGVWVEREVIERAVDIADVLANLNYLICVEANKPELVRRYSEQADERIRTLGKLLCKAGSQ